MEIDSPLASSSPEQEHAYGVINYFQSRRQPCRLTHMGQWGNDPLTIHMTSHGRVCSQWIVSGLETDVSASTLVEP